MSEARYRCTVQFDPEKQVFRARAPELEHCQAEGATRAEALARIEEEMDAQVRNMREQGAHPPTPADEESFTGEVQARLSRSLHRELVFQAREEGIELGQLMSELLAASLESRRAARGGPRRPAPAEHDGDRGDRGPRDRERPRQGYGGRYHGIMEDRANFIEYVRGLDQGAGGQHGGQGGGRHGGGGRRRHGKGGTGGPGGAGGGQAP
jgi:predicted HicB family RNase H-like nuclease